jgi:hypothetical protein
MSTTPISRDRRHHEDPLDTGVLSRTLPLRVSVSLRRTALTSQLAAGVSPIASPQLTLRAAQLIGLRAGVIWPAACAA